MIEAHIRSRIQPLFNALGSHCHHINPNTITLMALCAGISAGIATGSGWPLTALSLLWFSGLCDVMDGTIARLTGKSAQVGAYIDLIADRMVEATMILGFAAWQPEYALAYLTFVIAVLLHFSTFLAAGALFKNSGQKSMHYDHSFVERAEAFIVFSLMLLFPDRIFGLLMIFNTIIFADGAARFYRVVKSES